MTLLTIDPSLPLVWKDGRDLVMLSKDDADPGPWALAVARAVFWQIQGQWTFDLKKGIDYMKILGEFTNRKYCEEQMRRGLAPYFQVQSLSVREEINSSNGQPDLIVTWAARIRDQIVSGTVSFLEGAEEPNVSLLTATYDEGGQRLVLHFSRALSPNYPPAFGDFQIIGFEDAPTVTGVTLNGEALYLALSVPLVQEGTAPGALLYAPIGENMQALNRARVLPFRAPLSGIVPTLLDDEGEPILADTGEPIYA